MIASTPPRETPLRHGALLAFALLACSGPSATPTAISTPTPSLTDTPTPSATNTPSPTPTPSSSSLSPTPTPQGATPTTTPTATDYAPELPEGLRLMPIPGGTFTMGEPESDYEGPPNTWDSPPHSVTLSPFSISETEVTNAQYVQFLNIAELKEWVEVREESAPGPDQGEQLVYGTPSAPDAAKGVALVNLSGTRVMKDHDNEDGDNDPFTGEIEPENPLNISYIGYDTSKDLGERFYVKDPQNSQDFDWDELTNYYDYTSTPRELDTSTLKNDRANWPELEDYPNNLPTAEAVKSWPATFIRWSGALAFAELYSLTLPTEAQWEYAAQGGAGFIYATANGEVAGDGTSAIWNWKGEVVSRGHVQDVKTGDANPYGLYNLGGNVWEWMADSYASDFYEDGSDPLNSTETGTFVRRGGSWNYHQSTLKCAARFYDEPFKGNDHFGFRVVGE